MNYTLPRLSDSQLLHVVSRYQRGEFPRNKASATRYQDAVKALTERGYVVELAEETKEYPAVPRDAYED